MPPRRSPRVVLSDPELSLDENSQLLEERRDAIRRQTDATIAIQQANNAAEERRKDELHQAQLEAIRTGVPGASPPAIATVQTEGEHPPESLLLQRLFPTILPEHVTSIFQNKFKPASLWLLRTESALDENLQKKSYNIDIEDGQIKMSERKAIRNFGDDSSIWQEGFLNYTAIIVQFWGKTHPDLHLALSELIVKVLELSKVYEWRLVLMMVLRHHTQIVQSSKVTDPAAWELPRFLVDKFYTSTPSLRFSPADTTQGQSLNKRGSAALDPSTNNSSTVCRNFNSPRGCNRPDCHRLHKKTTYGSQEKADK
jgi:hypothetical protein